MAGRIQAISRRARNRRATSREHPCCRHSILLCGFARGQSDCTVSNIESRFMSPPPGDDGDTTFSHFVRATRQGDGLTARVDLKADRKASVLRVQNAHLESEADPGSTAEALSRELRVLADWLCLESVQIEKASAFERTLAGF